MTDKKPWRNRKERKDWARRLQSEDPGLEVVHPHAAGIDVGNGMHYVAVRPDRDPQPVRRALKKIRAQQIESYITKASKRLNRPSLQHDIGTLRGFLRFLAIDNRVPAGLASQIDTPRLYQLEKLPRALPWDTVRALVRSIDRTSAMGLRERCPRASLPQ